MSKCPKDLKYVESHEWVRIEEGNRVTVGITHHAQTELGDLVFIELPETGTEFAQGDEVGVVESVKTASDIYAPVSGKVVAVNELLEDAPESINSDAFGDGWIFQLEMSDTSELESLLSAEDYESQISTDEDE